MGLFNFKKNKDQNRDTDTSVGTGDTSKYDELLESLNKEIAETEEYNKSLGQAIDKTLEVFNERPKIAAVTKQTLQSYKSYIDYIDYDISQTSEFINQNKQLLEKAIFQEWAEKNNISLNVLYTRSFKNLSLEQIRSLSKFVSEKCEELECQKLNISKENIFREWAEKNNISPGVTLEQLPKEDKENYWKYKYIQIKNAKIQAKIQVNIRNRILKASKLINQDSQLLEKAIFQEWAKENDISSDKPYESSYTNLSLEQFRSLEKYVSDKCEKLESQKLNNSKEETFPEDEQQKQTQNEQQNTDKVDSPIPTENPIVPNKNNINEETTKIDLNEIYKKLNTTKEELYLQWMKNSIDSHDCMEFEEWVIKHYNYKVEEENRQKKLNEIYKKLNTTEEELRFKWLNEVYIPSEKGGYGDCMKFEDWVIEYYNNYKDNLEKKPRSR